MITVLVGDVSLYLSAEAKKISATASLITEKNCKNLFPGVYYTSAGEFQNYCDFRNALEQADELIYRPPKYWSDMDKKGNSQLKIFTEFILLYFNNKKIVKDIEHLVPESCVSMLKLLDMRKTEDRQLWAVGGSVVNGNHMRRSETFCQLLADRLNLPISFLSTTACSIEHSADQILRSDIREGDVIVWGISTHRILSYFSDSTKTVEYIHAGYYLKDPKFNNTINIDQLDSMDCLYRSVSSINQVVNICNKLNVKLILVGLGVEYPFIKYLYQLPNYVQYLGWPFSPENMDQWPRLDTADDGIHPGPLTHQLMADQVYKFIFKSDSKGI
jgi:hypothetical protein